jgi:hypothetical protein
MVHVGFLLDLFFNTEDGDIKRRLILNGLHCITEARTIYDYSCVKLLLLAFCMLVSRLAYFSILKMKTTYSSETSVNSEL